ncbi:hypothetical protein AO501_29115 [Mycobacterium gordonae]|uniref:Uncharacterized protein n=1 Tax=Mycobacterium gordonae TaxID=1778 RepID=A0A0Q2QWE1_MYCGO|nr:hypothetical protein [Mycobacterium gordonae]KQH76286.1 hypothetical protein AO501_29115 [Mycobacterium gordonae]
MSDNHDFDAQIDDVVERYLQFLRGQGPEPDLAPLTPPQRRVVRNRLDIVDALADRGPAVPPLHQDPVAMRLGLVPDTRPSPGSGGADPTGSQAPEPTAAPDPIRHVLEELEAAFGGDVCVDWSPQWAPVMTRAAVPLAQCSALGQNMALFLTDETDWANEPVQLASFLLHNPAMSAVALVTRDATRAAIFSAAACNLSIDPVRGWLEPGAFVVTDSFDLILRHYFEQRLPRWDRVAGLTEILESGDITAGALELVTEEIAAELRTRPRLEYKRRALEVLETLDPAALSALIVAVQAGTLSDIALVDQASALAETTP